MKLVGGESDLSRFSSRRNNRGKIRAFHRDRSESSGTSVVSASNPLECQSRELIRCRVLWSVRKNTNLRRRAWNMVTSEVSHFVHDRWCVEANRVASHTRQTAL